MQLVPPHSPKWRAALVAGHLHVLQLRGKGCDCGEIMACPDFPVGEQLPVPIGDKNAKPAVTGRSQPIAAEIRIRRQPGRVHANNDGVRDRVRQQPRWGGQERC